MVRLTDRKRLLPMRAVPSVLAFVVVVHAPAAAQDLDPRGRFTYERAGENGLIVDRGTYELAGTTGDWRVTIRNELGDIVEPESVSVSVTGTDMVMVLVIEGSEFVADVTFDGDFYTGTWAWGFEGGLLSGRRLRDGG